MKLCVLPTPDNILPEMLDGTAAVVIDTLRMTSVAAMAFENGCAGLYACAEVDAARKAAAACGGLLGGERNALRIEGFDFSNSPSEYTAERICGKKLIMSTSNGTRAIASCSAAKRVLLAAAVNARATARLIKDEKDVAILCAGTMRRFTLEDALTAGAIIARLEERGVSLELDDMALASRRMYEEAKGNLYAALKGTKHFERLRALRLEGDLHWCLAEDTVRAVAERGEEDWFYYRKKEDGVDQ